jgi:hypothetical protein
MAVEQEGTLDDVLAEEEGDDLGFPATEVTDDELEIRIEDEDEPPVEETPAEEPPVEAEAEAEEPATDDIPDSELGDDAKMYSKSAKSRVKREIRIRKQVEADFEQMREAAIQVAQVAQQRETELETTKAELINLKRQHVGVLEVTFGDRIALKSAELRTARDNGDYEAETKLQGDIDQLRFQQNKVRDMKQGLGDPSAAKPLPPTPPQPPQQVAQPPAPQQAAQPPAPLAVKWIDKNKAWFNNPQFAGHKSFVIGVDQQLSREGYDKYTPEYYAELDRRVDETFPTLRKKAAPASGSPVAPTSRAGGGAPAKPTKRSVTLTQADFATMRQFNLDPENVEHRKAFAMSKGA